MQKKGPGRPRDPRLDQYRDLFGQDWSERTIARFVAANRLLHDLGDEQAHRNALRTATRPNGTLNVAKFERLALGMTAMRQLDGDGT